MKLSAKLMHTLPKKHRNMDEIKIQSYDLKVPIGFPFVIIINWNNELGWHGLKYLVPQFKVCGLI